jgi:hypothetical protein
MSLILPSPENSKEILSINDGESLSMTLNLLINLTLNVELKLLLNVDSSINTLISSKLSNIFLFITDGLLYKSLEELNLKVNSLFPLLLSIDELGASVLIYNNSLDLNGILLKNEKNILINTKLNDLMFFLFHIDLSL